MHEADAQAPGRESALNGREGTPLDTETFDRMHRDYRERLVRSLAGFVRDQDKAEDIAAHAFHTAWEKRETFRGEARPETWLHAIARNEARQSLRNERLIHPQNMDNVDINELADAELPTDRLEKQDETVRLRKALNQLPDKPRRALVAHFVEGLSVQQIARRERVPLGTALGRIHRAKQLLREAWSASLAPSRAESYDFKQSISKPDRQVVNPRTRDGLRDADVPEPVAWSR